MRGHRRGSALHCALCPPWLVLSLATAPNPKPNVVLIVVDSLRRDRLSVYGHHRSTSRNIDSLAQAGVRYDRAYATAPWTTPSVASILSSRLASNIGIRRGRTALPDELELSSELLKRKGYHTGAVVSHSFVSSELNFDQGFDFFDESNVLDAEGISSEGVSDRAIEFLEDTRETPFFLFLHYFDPHFPYIDHGDFPRAEGDAYTGPIESGMEWELLRELEADLTPADVDELLRFYDSEVAYTDRHIGRVLNRLEAQGQLANTLVIFVADHGEEFLEHRRVGHTKTLYQELIAAPLIVRYPAGVIADGQSRVDDQPASTLDILPTVLEIVGLEVPSSKIGRSLLHVRPPDRPIFSETHRGSSLRAVISGDYKLIEDTEHKGYELFRLASDVGEQQDLYGAQLAEPAAERARSLKALLADWPASHPMADGPTVELSKPERRRLRALGYLME